MFLSRVPSQGKMDRAVSSYPSPCSKAARCRSQLLWTPQSLDVAGSYLPRDSL